MAAQHESQEEPESREGQRGDLTGPDLIKLAAAAEVSFSTAKRRARGGRVNSFNEQRISGASHRLGFRLPPVADSQRAPAANANP